MGTKLVHISESLYPDKKHPIEELVSDLDLVLVDHKTGEWKQVQKGKERRGRQVIPTLLDLPPRIFATNHPHTCPSGMVAT